jgi:general L-amino acid transport system permease protein
LFVSVVGIILSTILGVAVGVARLSTNWLISQIAGAYIELIRNTPLLVQLFFIYFGVFVTLPSIGQSLEFPGSIYANQRGVFVPRPVPTETFAIWVWFIVGAILLAFALNYFSARAPKLRLNWLALVALIGLPALGWLIAGNPVSFDLPVRERFNFRGGVGLSPEFSALLAGLVLYTAGFIAEVVRAGILAVRRGQIEAAYSLGFNGGQVLRMIIFPQALRVIVPPLTSQYLNLAKNSSLAIAIGFPDLFSVATTSANQTGQPVPVYLLVMATYLAMSLFTSLLMNLYNRRVQILEK